MSARMNLGVGDAGHDDLAAIAALEESAFPLDPWSPALMAEAVAGALPTTAVFVARGDDGFVGYAVLAVVDVDAELQRIAVEPAHRGRGVATMMLGLVAGIAAHRGAERLLLEVREDNEPALRLYRSAGFDDLGRRERYYRDGTAALVLARPLDPPDAGPDAAWRMAW